MEVETQHLQAEAGSTRKQWGLAPHLQAKQLGDHRRGIVSCWFFAFKM
ncbi:MAG: hypothetical protein ACYCVB_06855 [Bacilli bacterium]